MRACLNLAVHAVNHKMGDLLRRFVVKHSYHMATTPNKIAVRTGLTIMSVGPGVIIC